MSLDMASTFKYLNMKNIVFLLLSIYSSLAVSQTTTYEVLREGMTGSGLNPEWAPFYHGVASGDPDSKSVVLWTRVTPDSMSNADIEGTWRLCTDKFLMDTIQSGVFTTNVSKDYTVNLVVDGLEAGTTYYYGFEWQGRTSLTGRTRTAPDDMVDNLKFAVASCSNYPAGYFNAYGRIGEREDLDAVIHLGDYIYEYANRVFGDTTLQNERMVLPDQEIISLEDYRIRYSTYRLDTNLIRLHQQHPIIAVWDDHETANDSYRDGAQNHDPSTEGDWEERKAAGKQAYFEWMPIRNDGEKVYRSIDYGPLMSLIMLDTRLEGRDQQISDVNSPALLDPDRTILGAEQKSWFLDQLENDDSKWKVIGQQVIFSPLNVGWASLIDPSQTYDFVEGLFLDIWDGYPAERKAIIDFVREKEIDNIVVLTGDFHSTFAFDVVDTPTVVTFQDIPGIGSLPFYGPSMEYDPTDGRGSAFVEFATPSITSANFDENAGELYAQQVQNVINQDLINGINLGNPNPHMKFVDLIQHGYFVLDVRADSVQANWYYGEIGRPVNQETFAGAFYTKSEENRLQGADAESPAKSDSPDLAPPQPPRIISSTRPSPPIQVLQLFPNPSSGDLSLQMNMPQGGKVEIDLLEMDGKLLKNLHRTQLPPGLFQIQLDLGPVKSGVYVLRLKKGGESVSHLIRVQR